MYKFPIHVNVLLLSQKKGERKNDFILSQGLANILGLTLLRLT